MKKFAVVMLSVLTIPAYAQSVLGSLQTYQKEIQAKSSSTPVPGAPAAKVDPVAKTKTSGLCTEPDQTSLPLAYVTALIMEKDGKLAVGHDSRSGKLSVSSPEMISNCASMIEWVPNTRDVDGKKVYSIEAKIKKGEECVDDVCSYDVAKVEKGVFKSFEKVKVKATMVGFEECLEKSGVVKAGKVVEDAIYPSAIDERFDGYKESGDVLFLSHGPSSKLVKAKYDKFVEVDKCDHYEKITPEGIVLKSLSQEEAERFAAEEKQVRECGEYEKISDFMQKYEAYSEDLNVIRDQLILEAVKKSAKAISEGKYTEEDLKVLADFDKYIVQPKIAEARLSYNKAQLMEGSEKAAELEYMKGLLATLQTYNNVPYISSALVTKLEAEGRFNEAALANGMKALIVSHNRLGAKENGVLITPEVAQQRAQAINQGYGKALEIKKEKYEIRTGQTSGQAKEYSDLVGAMNRNIQKRSQSYGQAIQDEYRRMQPGGYCYNSPFRNSQKCVQESMQYIQELQAQMQHNNKVDYDRAVEYAAKANEYAKLEKEGSDYIARQNGETPSAAAPVDTTVPGPRPGEGAQPGQGNPYEQQTLAYQGQGQNQQMQMQGQQNPYMQQNYMGMNQQNQFMQQQNPYAQQNFGQPNFMGQQNYGYQVNFGMNSQYGQYGNQYGQQQYSPYGQQQYQNQGNPYMQQQSYMPMGQNQSWSPYTAYNNYSMYGGR